MQPLSDGFGMYLAKPYMVRSAGLMLLLDACLEYGMTACDIQSL